MIRDSVASGCAANWNRALAVLWAAEKTRFRCELLVLREWLDTDLEGRPRTPEPLIRGRWRRR